MVEGGLDQHEDRILFFLLLNGPFKTKSLYPYEPNNWLKQQHDRLHIPIHQVDIKQHDKNSDRNNMLAPKGMSAGCLFFLSSVFV